MKQKTYKDKSGREYIKESYFVGGKMKFRKVYVISGLPVEEFYKNNATDIDHYLNGEYWLISSEKDSGNNCEESNRQKPYLSEGETEDLPF